MGPFWVSRDQKRPGWDPLTDPLPKKAMMFITPGMATFPKVSSNSVPNIPPLPPLPLPPAPTLLKS